MGIRMHECEDEEEAREAFLSGLPGDQWPAKHNPTVWTARHGKTVCGMLAATHWEAANAVYLAGAAVPLRFRDRGVYQHMLRFLERWARKQGAVAIVTYTLLHNYPSIGGLLAAGYRFALPPKKNQFVGPHVHYFAKPLPKKSHRAHQV